MKCPVDNIDLIMSDRQGVEIDYCPQCRGVWLDRGEIDKIVERSQGMNPGPAAPVAGQPQYQQPSHQNYRRDDRHHHDDDDDRYRQQHGGQHHKRKESWLGDLFD